ncbi:MAG: DNA polymerase III subunit gamma/tau [Ezakiella sp.]|uniref:DNA polymerase III subunit gamma/tau n=1 Tax=Ezakiella sp. TaxID=1935205 RepID=UPI002974C3B6|nr:DNA polymerase III subunit gamma/tau [Ezakiella sp.]MDD7731178.1 DNA polymerase III subunit gamma/tau [Eubacteriales bacterium]MDY6079773.1 DNA polymerase III subunit gamma/tau [Ezakiella sp.]
MTKALYRVLRPKTWSEVVDKDLIVEVLRNQVKNDSVSHGYLFCGLRGTGKTSCAKILARAVNCLNPHDGEPCNECENCKAILEDRAVDVLELDAASNNGVDNIRELKELGVYPPTTLKKKVYIIDEAHMLSNSAFNALLKILEEPPKHLIFILATTEPEKLPDTVKSRLQRFDFHGISKDRLEDSLRNAAKGLKEEVSDEVFGIIADNAGGSMRDALSMLDQLLSIPIRPITPEIISSLLGFTGIDEIAPLLTDILNHDVLGVMNETADIMKRGRSGEKTLYALMKACRDLYLVKMGETDGLSTKRKEVLEKISEYVDENRILDLIESFRKLIDGINYAYDEALMFQMGLVEIARNRAVTTSVSNSRETKIPKFVKEKKETDFNELFSKNVEKNEAKVQNEKTKSEPSDTDKEKLEKDEMKPIKNEVKQKDKNEKPQKESDFEERPFFEPEESDYLNLDEEFTPDVSGWESKTNVAPKKGEKEVELKKAEEPEEVVEEEKDLKDSIERKKTGTDDLSKAEEKIEEDEEGDDGTLQNEEGEKMFDKIVEGNPLLQSSKNNYYIKLIKKKLIFTPKNSEEDFIFNSSKKELTEKMNEIVGGGASVEIRSSNTEMQRAIDLFGDKLEIR